MRASSTITLLILFGLGLALAGCNPQAATQPAEPFFNHAATPSAEPAETLCTTLSAHATPTVRAAFRCTKTLANSTQPNTPPLVCNGIITAEAGFEPAKPLSGASHPPHPSAVHWATRTPYISDLILRSDKTLARSEHETTWTVSHPPSPAKPGLTLVHTQIGAWLRGDPAGLRTLYQISAEPTAASLRPQLIFVLTPTSKELSKNLTRITLAITPADEGGKGGQLLDLQILTPAGATITYEFSAIQRPAVLSESEFNPPTHGVPSAASQP